MNTGTRSLSCQQCGGILSLVDSHSAYRCEYCQSVTVISEAPLLVDGILPVDEAVNAHCPSCTDCLQSAELDGRPILYCPGCLGIFLRRAHFGSIVNERRSKRVGLEQQPTRPIDPDAFSRRLNCPACQREMETHPYYGPGNVVIDSCEKCDYIWLDHGELSRVERSEGGRESVNRHLPQFNSGYSGTAPGKEVEDRSPIAILADFLF